MLRFFNDLAVKRFVLDLGEVVQIYVYTDRWNINVSGSLRINHFVSERSCVLSAELSLAARLESLLKSALS